MIRRFFLTLPAAALLMTAEEAPLALKGYDPVAYFTQGKAVPGNQEYAVVHAGRTYRFSSPDHRASFQKSPERYLPQYAGYCAWAVANNYLYPADPTAFTVYDGQLFLNANQDVSKKFNQDLPGLVAKGRNNWPGLKHKAK